MKKYNIITLCGSTRFKNEFMEIQKKLTMEGNIVLSLGVFNHSGDKITDEQWKQLVEMHKQKIDMSDEIFVINVDGYIGESTRSEIEYAKEHGKKIRFLENPEVKIKFIPGNNKENCIQVSCGRISVTAGSLESAIRAFDDKIENHLRFGDEEAEKRENLLHNLRHENNLGFRKID